MNAAVGHYGYFDFQRNQGAGYFDDGRPNVFFKQYSDGSNFAGVFLQGMGLDEKESLRVSLGFARMFSSNPGAADQVRFTKYGWQAANAGGLDGL